MRDSGVSSIEKAARLTWLPLTIAKQRQRALAALHKRPSSIEVLALLIINPQLTCWS